MMFIPQIFFKIQGKITRLGNIGHCDLHSFLGQSWGNTEGSSESMVFIYEITFKIKDKITGLLNIGHCDLHLF